MDARQAIRCGLEMAQHVALAYVDDLTDEQLMMRPHPNCNHINWQLGHLILSEHELLSSQGFTMPALPPGFAAKYSKASQGSDNPADFLRKQDLLQAATAQRQGTLAALESVSEADLDRSTSIHYAPTLGALFSLQGSHWLMHAGQWVIVRRQLGKPALF